MFFSFVCLFSLYHLSAESFRQPKLALMSYLVPFVECKRTHLIVCKFWLTYERKKTRSGGYCTFPCFSSSSIMLICLTGLSESVFECNCCRFTCDRAHGIYSLFHYSDKIGFVCESFTLNTPYCTSLAFRVPSYLRCNISCLSLYQFSITIE